MKYYLVLLVLFIIVTPAFSEVINIWGKLVYEDGKGIRNALVTMINTGTNEVFYDTTDQNGNYSIGTPPLSVSEKKSNKPVYKAFITNSVGMSCNFYFFDREQIDFAYVINIMGQQVGKIRLNQELLSTQNLWSNSGFWNGQSISGHQVADGIYFIVTQTSKGTRALKFHHNRAGSDMSIVSYKKLQIAITNEETSAFVEEYIPVQEEFESDKKLEYFVISYEELADSDPFLMEPARHHVLFSREVNTIVDTVESRFLDNQRILFIGNSYTHYNDGVNFHLKSLFLSANPDLSIDIQRITTGGWSLENHWFSEETQNKLSDYEWDMVILQDKSTGPVYNPELTQRYAELFDSSIDESGAQTGFYMTWAREFDPGMIFPISTLYNSLGRELNAFVSPVGLAWQNALEEDLGIDLYIEDGSHPTIYGTYLAACVFYSTIFHKSPARIFYGSEFMDRSIKIFLQRIAWETVKEYNNL